MEEDVDPARLKRKVCLLLFGMKGGLNRLSERANQNGKRVRELQTLLRYRSPESEMLKITSPEWFALRA